MDSLSNNPDDNAPLPTEEKEAPSVDPKLYRPLAKQIQSRELAQGPEQTNVSGQTIPWQSLAGETVEVWLKGEL